MLRICEHPDCTTMTLGALCLAHETRVVERFPRGRPYPQVSRKQGLEVTEVPQSRQARALSFGGGS
jgi:hypothetical protein